MSFLVPGVDAESQRLCSDGTEWSWEQKTDDWG